MNQLVWKLVERFAPIVYLHPQELYLPQSIPLYLQQCQLWQDHSKRINAPLTALTLPQGPGHQCMSVKPVDTKTNYGHPTFQHHVPYYVHTRHSSPNPTHIDITYIFTYAYNGPLHLFGCSSLPVGAHQADVEHVTFRIDVNQQMLVKAYFAAHQSQDGMWVVPEQMQWEQGRPVVYAALGSHASYPQPQTYWRLWGAANDHCAQGGKRWDPLHREGGGLERIDENTWWNTFSGHLGYPDHVATPMYQRWWNDESRESTSWWQRWCCGGARLPWYR
jgi:hypothetical protein